MTKRRDVDVENDIHAVRRKIFDLPEHGADEELKRLQEQIRRLQEELYATAEFVDRKHKLKVESDTRFMRMWE